MEAGPGRRLRQVKFVFPFAPNTDTQSFFLSLSSPRHVKAERADSGEGCLCPHLVTSSCWPQGPAFLCPVLGSQPPATPGSQTSQGQAVLEKCWEVAECAVCEFPPNWRPNPWTNSSRVCLSTTACVLLPGQEIPRAVGMWGAGRQADVTNPRVCRREALTDRVMTGLPPAPPGPPALRQGGQTEGSPRTRFSHLCCHTGHPTKRDGIHTLQNYYLVLAHFWVEARGVHCCLLLTLEASD